MSAAAASASSAASSPSSSLRNYAMAVVLPWTVEGDELVKAVRREAGVTPFEHPPGGAEAIVKVLAERCNCTVHDLEMYVPHWVGEHAFDGRAPTIEGRRRVVARYPNDRGAASGYDLDRAAARGNARARGEIERRARGWARAFKEVV